MTGLHARSATNTSVGATAGTFNQIEAAGTFTILNDEATSYWGPMISAAPVAVTAAEAMSARVRLTSTTLGLVGEIFTYGAAVGAQIGVNDQGAFFPVDWIPMDIKATGGERITTDWTTYTPAVTNAWSVVVSHVHPDADVPPAAYAPFWAGGSNPPCQGGDSNNATVSATARTTLGVTTIEGKFSHVCGIRPAVAQDPVGVAGEEVVGFIELTSAIAGLDPMHFPMPSIAPTLGVPVGGPIQHAPIRFLPAYVKRTEKLDRSFEAFLNLSVAITAVNGFSYNLAFHF